MTEPTRPCGTCGMPCTPGEYHPYAACLMFKACHNSETVRTNLEAVRGTPPAVAGNHPYAIQWDAELGRTAMRFVDRAGDVHPGIDDAETICAEFHAAMSAVIERMPHVQRMSPTPQPTQAQAGAITPPPIECNTEELKRAYAFGWWSALEKQRETVQAGAVPLTDEQAKALLKNSDLLDMFLHIGWYSAPRKNFDAHGLTLIRAIEAAHGIKGGQHAE